MQMPVLRGGLRLVRFFSLPRCARGFTLVEVLAVLAIASVLFTLAQTSLLGLVQYVRLQSAIQQWMASAHLARATAIDGQRSAKLCPSSDGFSCTSNTLYHQGWLVLQAGRLLQDTPPSAAQDLRILAPGNISKGLEFLPSGTPSSAFSGATLVFVLGAYKRCLVIGRTGRMRQEAC